MSDDQSREMTHYQPKDIAPKIESIDLPTAQEILQSIISTHENSITESTPLDLVAEYSTTQVREAMKVVCEDLIKGNKTESFLSSLHTYKDTPQGRLHLFLSEEFDSEGKNNHTKEKIKLMLSKNDSAVLENDYRLTEPINDTQRVFAGFIDFRGQRVDQTNLWSLGGKPQL
ncbi:MAG: hypothetical protein ABIO02_00550, partial [Patescibacteria group bacterium]